jgi:hypothetical protein
MAVDMPGDMEDTEGPPRPAAPRRPKAVGVALTKSRSLPKGAGTITPALEAETYAKYGEGAVRGPLPT